MGRIGAGAALARIERSRQHEAQVQSLKHEVQLHHFLKARGLWESQIEEKQKLISQQRRSASLRAVTDAEIVAKKQQAVEQMRTDKDPCIQCLAAKDNNSSTKRKDERIEMARRLAASKEAERAKVAEEKIAQQFAENCDLLRTLKSQLINKRMVEDWSHQKTQKMQQKDAIAKQDLKDAEAFEAYMQKYEERHLAYFSNYSG